MCLLLSPLDSQLYSLNVSIFIFDDVTMKTPQLKSCGEAGKGWLLLTSLSLSPIGKHIFLRSKNDIFRYHTRNHFSDFVTFFKHCFFLYIFLSVLNSYPATRFLITPLLARPRPNVELLFIYILFYLPHHSSN